MVSGLARTSCARPGMTPGDVLRAPRNDGQDILSLKRFSRRRNLSPEPGQPQGLRPPQGALHGRAVRPCRRVTIQLRKSPKRRYDNDTSQLEGNRQ
jgi:hypothetical protein